MKVDITGDQATDCFAGFPVVLASVGGEKDNIITLAMCHVFSFRPPYLGVGISPKRFSHGLFKASKDFAINIPDRNMLKAVQLCGTKSGKNVDKFEAAGLTREKAKKIASPLIAECPVSIECAKVNEVDAGDHTWFVGEVVAAKKEPSYKDTDMILYWGKYRVIGELLK